MLLHPDGIEGAFSQSGAVYVSTSDSWSGSVGRIDDELYFVSLASSVDEVGTFCSVSRASSCWLYQGSHSLKCLK